MLYFLPFALRDRQFVTRAARRFRMLPFQVTSRTSISVFLWLRAAVARRAAIHQPRHRSLAFPERALRRANCDVRPFKLTQPPPPSGIDSYCSEAWRDRGPALVREPRWWMLQVGAQSVV